MAPACGSGSQFFEKIEDREDVPASGPGQVSPAEAPSGFDAIQAGQFEIRHPNNRECPVFECDGKLESRTNLVERFLCLAPDTPPSIPLNPQYLSEGSAPEAALVRYSEVGEMAAGDIDPIVCLCHSIAQVSMELTTKRHVCLSLN